MEKLTIGISKSGIMVGGERLPLLTYDNPSDDPIQYYPEQTRYFDIELQPDTHGFVAMSYENGERIAVSQGDNRDHAIQMIAEATVIVLTPLEDVFTEDEAIRMQKALADFDPYNV